MFHKHKLFSIVLSMLCILIVVIVFLIGVFVYKRHQAQNLNLILISVDTLRADHMGVYGYDKNTTPNIDKWAKDATVFTNAYTTVPATYPSLVSLMTGKSPFNTQITNNTIFEVNGKVIINGNKINRSIPTLATILKSSGYSTGAFISNPNLFKDMSNLDIGFDIYHEYYWNDLEKENTNFINKSLDWMDKNKHKKLFYWIHILDPHEPYIPPLNYQCRFDSSNCKKINNLTLNKLNDEREKIKGCQIKPLSNSTIELHKTLYDGEIGYVDVLVGKILNKIKLLNLDKRSLVVFYSDHGEGFDHNYYFTHSMVLYNSSVKIPLIIQHPYYKSKENNFQKTLISNDDLFQTLLNLINISKSQDIFNKQKFSYIYNDSNNISRFIKKPDQVFIVNINASKYAIINGRYKYIYSLDKKCRYNGQNEELYDLKLDRNETINIINKNKKIYEMLKSKLLIFMKENKLEIKSSIEMDQTLKLRESINNLKYLGY